jgi:hypothetical protein
MLLCIAQDTKCEGGLIMGWLSPEEINSDLFDEVKRLKAEVKRLEESLKMYKEENEKLSKSTHINTFLYEFNVNENGEIPCLIKVNGIEHSFGIDEKTAKAFIHIFEMAKFS